MSIAKFLKMPFIILSDLAKLFIIYTPGRTGVRLRRAYYKQRFKRCGDNLIVDVGVCIDGLELISVGDNVCIDKYCVIATGDKLIGKVEKRRVEKFSFEVGEIVIGSNVHIAQFCILMGYGGIQFGDNVVLSAGSKIYSLTNTAYDLQDRSKVVSVMPYDQANFLLAAVVLEKNVWCGLNTIAMPGAIVGQNSFCVSNSLLINKYQENSYLAGQPANRVRMRFITKNVEADQ